MTNFEKGAAIFAIVITLMLGFVTIKQAQSGATADRIDAAAARLDTQVSRIDEAFSQIAGTNVQVTQVATTINGIDKAVADLSQASLSMTAAMAELPKQMSAALGGLAGRMDKIEATLIEINGKLASNDFPENPIVLKGEYGPIWANIEAAKLKGPIFIWSSDPETSAELERIKAGQP